MTFVNPLLLAGTALLALPVVLHLIMRQKPKLLEFPALRFIQKRHDTNRRRLMLRHILLLLLRAGAIVLLAAALAQPSVNFSGVLGTQEAPVAAALVFDAAPRMDYRHDNQSRLEAARQFAQWLLAQLPRHSQIAVLDTRLERGVLQDDRGLSEQRIERLLAVANSQPLTSVVDEALRLVQQSDLPRKEIYIFTDLSRAAWPTDSAAGLQQRITDVPGVVIYVIDVGIDEPINCALGELRLSGQVLSNRGTLGIETELSRTGPTEGRSVELYLLDNQRQRQKRDEESFELGSGQPQQVSFRVAGLGIGTHQGFVRIVGQDGLAWDDTRYFTVEVTPAWRILVAAPKPPQRYALYLTEALAPTVFRKRGQARFDCQIVDLEELPQQPLDGYAAVCLLDPTPLKPAVWQKLEKFASAGHGVAIFLGRNAKPVDSFNTPQAQKLLPGTLVRQARAPGGDVWLAPRSYEHPILSEFRDLAGSVPWHFSPVFRYWQLENPAGEIAGFNDGRPALLERPSEGGHVLTMTTPVSDDPNRQPWNLLPVSLEADQQWPFLILVNRMMSYLVGSSDQRLNYFAGQTAVLQFDSNTQLPSYVLSTPDDLKFNVSADPNQHLLMVTSTDQVGNYRVRAGGPPEVDRGFSVDLAPEQTRLDRIAEDELKEVFGPFAYRLARTRNQIEREISTGRVGRELFPLLILLVAAVLGAEHVVANRFYRQ